MDVLVHIASKTSKSGDDRVRRQAAAYHNFEARQRIDITRDVIVAKGSHGDSSDLHQSHAHFSLSFVDDTQLATSRLESQLVSSSLRAALESGSSCPSTPQRPGTFQSHVPWSPVYIPPPLSPDALRTPNLAPAHSMPSHASVQSHQDAVFIRPALPGSKISPRKNTEGSTWSTGDDLPHELPSTYSVTDTSKASSSQRRISNGELPHQEPVTPSQSAPQVRSDSQRTDGGGQGDVSDLSARALGNGQMDGPRRQSPPGPSRTSIAAEEEGLQVRRHDSDQTSEVQPLGAADEDDRRVLVSLVESTTDSTISARLTDLPLCVRPPPPTTALDAQPATFLTSSLIAIKANPRLSDRFKPKSITRQIRPTERGYWTFTPRFEVDIQREFWTFLADTIRSGCSGWGVWCVRKPSGDAEGHALGEIRVFCWGEIVEHIYLLLYVCSRSWVRKTRATWCDAEGAVVVQM